MTQLQLQQGDILVRQVTAIPEAARLRETEGSIVLAHGESGHTHQILAPAATTLAYELHGELYLDLSAPEILTHEEHRALSIPPGIYLVGRVREYDYPHRSVREVAD